MESLCKVVLGAQQKAPNLNALNALNATFKSTFCLSKWFLGQYLCKRPQKSVSCYWQICSGSIFKVLSLKIFWWGILKCMMMMIGQMMKLRKQARSIWQRGALEWWSGASALSADGYCTNTILSDIDFYIYQYWSDTDFHLHIFKADIDIHLVAFQMRELAL